MKQTRLLPLVALAGMALGGGLAVHAVQQSDTASSIYMASALYARLARSPRAWNGRTVLVRGARRRANPLPLPYAEQERSAAHTLAAHDATRHDARWRYRLRLEAAGLRDGSGQWHSASREEIGPT